MKNPVRAYHVRFRQLNGLAVHHRFAPHTPAESKLWRWLKDEQLGVRFTHQYPVLNDYIADFACVEFKLLLEVDGSVHDSLEAMLNDCERDARLERAGWRVLRFENTEVMLEIKDVIARIQRMLKELLPAGYELPQAIRSQKGTKQHRQLLDYYHRRGA